MPTKTHKTKSAEEVRAEKTRRAKARRVQRRQKERMQRRVGDPKPLDEWDMEELARGRQRDVNGEFKGRVISVIPRAIYEEAISRFKTMTQADIRALVPSAVDAIHELITNNAVDEKGRMVIPPSVKLAASQWVVEHLVGKPTQRIEGDISVRLQGILASAMVSPDLADSAKMRPAIDAESWEEADSDDDSED